MPDFKELLKSEEDIKKDIIKDFALGFLNEVEKLVNQYGKEEVMNMIKNKKEKATETEKSA